MASNDNGLGVLRLHDFEMIFKNFSGMKSDYNNEGDRNFGVIIDADTAEALRADGVNVKTLRPRANDPDSVERYWIKVKVNLYSRNPPKVYLIKADPEDPKNEKKMRTVRLNEDTIGQLDMIHQRMIYTSDIAINFYVRPDRPGRPGGTSNYLSALYLTIMDDPLERKYSSIIREAGDDFPVDDDPPFDVE